MTHCTNQNKGQNVFQKGRRKRWIAKMLWICHVINHPQVLEHIFTMSLCSWQNVSGSTGISNLPCRWEVLWGFLRVHIFLLLPQNTKSMLKSCHFALCHLKWEPAVCFWIHLKSNCLAVAGSSADCGKMFSVLPL